MLVVIKDRVVTTIDNENVRIMELLLTFVVKEYICIKYLTANCFINSYYIHGLFNEELLQTWSICHKELLHLLYFLSRTKRDYCLFDIISFYLALCLLNG